MPIFLSGNSVLGSRLAVWNQIGGLDVALIGLGLCNPALKGRGEESGIIRIDWVQSKQTRDEGRETRDERRIKLCARVC